MMKIPLLFCLLASITITEIIAQEIPVQEENIEDSSKIYIKQFINTINGGVTYKSPVFFAIGDK